MWTEEKWKVYAALTYCIFVERTTVFYRAILVVASHAVAAAQSLPIRCVWRWRKGGVMGRDLAKAIKRCCKRPRHKNRWASLGRDATVVDSSHAAVLAVMLGGVGETEAPPPTEVVVVVVVFKEGVGKKLVDSSNV